jgi:hypothetical protein
MTVTSITISYRNGRSRSPPLKNRRAENRRPGCGGISGVSWWGSGAGQWRRAVARGSGAGQGEGMLGDGSREERYGRRRKTWECHGDGGQALEAWPVVVGHASKLKLREKCKQMNTKSMVYADLTDPAPQLQSPSLSKRFPFFPSSSGSIKNLHLDPARQCSLS